MRTVAQKLERLVRCRLRECCSSEQMVLEEGRLLSFKNVPKSIFKVSPLKLAEAGFFYVPSQSSRDAVECAFCGIILDKWNPDDEPWTEHREHTKANATRKAVKCPFVLLGKPQKEMTAKELRDLIQARFDLVLENLREEMINLVEEM